MTPSPPDQSISAEARLVAISGPLSGEVLPLLERGVRIGRDTSNDICLADLALSRVHCTIDTVDGRWRIRDSRSSNGTFVNGAQVTDHHLSDRDRIELGESVFLFMLNAHPRTIPLLLDRPLEPATRLRVEDAVYLQHGSEASATARIERDLRALLRVSTTLNRITTEDELYGQLLDLLAGSLPADQVAVVAVGSDGESRIVDARQLAGAPAAPVNQAVVDDAIKQRASLLTSGAEPTVPPHAEGVVNAAMQSILCAPMVVRDHAMGALYLTTRRADAFDTNHLEFATAVANVAAIALDNVRHMAWLHRDRARLQESLEHDHSLVGRSAAMRRI
jgi:predicted component of type VI protein secretion system